eukprot:tig00021314_g20130.t1
MPSSKRAPSRGRTVSEPSAGRLQFPGVPFNELFEGRIVIHVIAAREAASEHAVRFADRSPFVVVTEPGGATHKTLPARGQGSSPAWYEKVEFELEKGVQTAFRASLFCDPPPGPDAPARGADFQGTPVLVGKLVVNYSAMVAEGRKVDAWLPIRDRRNRECGMLHLSVSFADLSKGGTLLPEPPPGLGLPPSKSVRRYPGGLAAAPPLPRSNSFPLFNSFEFEEYPARDTAFPSSRAVPPLEPTAPASSSGTGIASLLSVPPFEPVPPALSPRPGVPSPRSVPNVQPAPSTLSPRRPVPPLEPVLPAEGLLRLPVLPPAVQRLRAEGGAEGGGGGGSSPRRRSPLPLQLDRDAPSPRSSAALASPPARAVA